MSNNDGQMDELLYMSGLLAKRIGDITQSRIKIYGAMVQSGQDVSTFSINPTIADIESSHSLLVSRSYRPYVMIAFEYLKNKMSAGNNGWGQEVQFYPRTFGEFMSDTALFIELSPFFFTDIDLRTVVATGNQANGNTILPWNTNPVTAANSTSLTSVENQLVDMTGSVLMDRAALGNSNATMGTVYPNPIYVRNYIQYAEFPMHRIVKSVKFQVNSTDIDNYTTETDSFFLLFQLLPNKRANYYKCVGQELPVDGYTSSLITDDTIGQGVFGGTTPNSSTTSYISGRKQVSVVSGYQTPQYVQPAFNGFYPNKFDHCNGIRCAIPVLAMPNAERAFLYTLCDITELLYAYCPVFLRQTSTTWTFSQATNSTPAIDKISSTATLSQLDSALLNGTLQGNSTANMQSITMYINNVFVDPSIHDIYLERIGFSLTRVHRTQALQMNTSTLEQTLSQFKWPIEFFFVGLRPSSSNGAALSQRNWWRFSYVQNKTGFTYANTYTHTLSTAATVTVQAPGSAVVATGLPVGTILPTQVAIPQSFNAPCEMISWDYRVPSIDTMQVSLQTIILFDTYNAKFYNAYLPYIFGGFSISGTEDNSALFCTFCFTPNDGGSPSGHVNTSRSREFTINISSSVVGSGQSGSDATGTVYCISNVINFWLISSGNLFLRFS